MISTYSDQPNSFLIALIIFMMRLMGMFALYFYSWALLEVGEGTLELEISQTCMGTHRRYAPQKGNFSLAVKIVKVILNLHFDIWKTFKKHFELEFLECTNHEHSFWAAKLPFFLVVYHE